MNRPLAPYAQYLTSEFHYNFEAGPRQNDVIKHGNNCEWLAHRVVESLTGFALSPDMLSYEIATSTALVDVTWRQLLPGDILLLGDPSIGDVADFKPRFDTAGDMTNWPEWPVNHLAVFTGRERRHGDPVVAHASPVANGNIEEPLSKVQLFPNHRAIFSIKRVTPPPGITV